MEHPSSVSEVGLNVSGPAFQRVKSGNAGRFQLMTGQADNKVFFTRCIEENLDALYGVALRLTGKAADADDLVAEAVARAWAALPSLEDRSRFRPWAFRILRNCYISDYRRKSVRPNEAVYDELADGKTDGDVCTMLMDESSCLIFMTACET